MNNIVSSVPQHVAIIMDGNGRWAANKGRPRSYGHHRGAAHLRDFNFRSALLDRIQDGIAEVI